MTTRSNSQAAGANPQPTPTRRSAPPPLEEILARTGGDPARLSLEVLELHQRLQHAQQKCAETAEAAGKLEAMLQDLLAGNQLLCRLETLRETLLGPRAVCRTNGVLRELPIHPNVDVEQLRRLKPWDYVAIREDVVVGSWSDDPRLYASALGEVVTFKGYKDREAGLACVGFGPEERIVLLDDSLRDEELLPTSRLVLQRDQSHLAIGMVPAQHTRSRFEVPIERLQTRLQDLAGVEEIAEKMLEDILLRIFHPELRDQYGLDPLKGILLYSKPGMGKTALMRAIALWLHEHSQPLGFTVVLYVVKPNETKSMWHGEDSRIMREELWGAIRARQQLLRSGPLVQIVVFDEIDSLGRRAGAGEQVYSSAQSDALESLLVEMDGMDQQARDDGPPAYVLCAGMTNRPDRVDEAAKRPGRFDLVMPMPEPDRQSAEDVMAVYARGGHLPWYLQGDVRSQVDPARIREQVLRPALARIFPAVIIRYKTDTQRAIDVTAGQLLANVHYKDAMNRAKKRAALRQLRQVGVPAVGFDDVMDCLVDVAGELARQLEADPHMLLRQLNVKVPVASVEAVPMDELRQHHYLRLQTA
ncbi:MAG: AAA family ATPase [Pirellulaceae bacterium]|nr:AAA family ATPase [Pirellulaceae bacterium]